MNHMLFIIFKVCMSLKTKGECEPLNFCHWDKTFGCTPYTKNQQITQMVRK